jgi:ABC-2 type transport system permease protein
MRTSFLSQVIGMTLVNGAYIVMWCTFANVVGSIGGWTAWDVVAMQGFAIFSYGIVFSFMYGIARTSRYVANGSFDQYMLSPKNTLLRLAFSSIKVSALGDALFGIICLTAYAIAQKLGTVPICYILAGLFISALTMIGIRLAIESLSFRFSDPRTVTVSFFEMFMSPANFHGGAFQGWLRFIFTFVIPSLLIGTLPVETVKHISWNTLGFLALMAVLWLCAGIWLFYRGIRRYESANLTTFGT